PVHAVARQDVQPAAPETSGGADGVLDGLQEVVRTSGIAQIAPIARREVAGLGVEEDELQVVPAQLPLDAALIHVVGEEELHGLEAGRRGPPEALEKRHLVEQHGQVRCVPEHGHVETSSLPSSLSPPTGGGSETVA